LVKLFKLENINMIKRTLFFGNPAYLSTKKSRQIVISYLTRYKETKTVAIEDIGLSYWKPTNHVTNGLLEKLTNNNVALINCDQQHLPIGLLMPLNGLYQTKRTWRIKLMLLSHSKKNFDLAAKPSGTKSRNQAGRTTQENPLPKNGTLGTGCNIWR
jgi:CRISPR-associated protein Cas1